VPGLPTTSKGAATSRRILDAAAQEFAERGIAGARVDRIMTAARTNKAQLYGYFGSKDALFDAVIADRGAQTLAAIEFDADDLPAMAVRIYDRTLGDPQIVRLMAWARLERPRTGPLREDPQHETKLAAITAAQQAGRVRPGDPQDILALVIAMALTWSAAAATGVARPDDPAEVHDRRRDLLRDSVRRALAV